MKKGLAIVIGMGKTPKPDQGDEADSEESAESPYDQTESDYAKVILEAAKDGDPDQFGEALRGFVRACIRKYASK
jgi:hypothetical protein